MQRQIRAKQTLSCRHMICNRSRVSYKTAISSDARQDFSKNIGRK